MIMADNIPPLNQAPALTKQQRQAIDNPQLNPSELKRLALNIGDTYIDPYGNRRDIKTIGDVTLAINYIIEGKGIFVLKGKSSDPNSADIAQTVSYQDKNGIDIIVDGGLDGFDGYTATSNDDSEAIKYSRKARETFTHDFQADGNAQQQSAIKSALANFEKNSPGKNAITLTSAEKYLYNITKSGTTLTTQWLVDRIHALSNKNTNNQLNQADQNELNAVSRLFFDEPNRMNIDKSKDNILSAAELAADYKTRTGNTI
jgi:hypothetical protein